MFTLLFSVTGLHMSTLAAKTFDFSSRTIVAPGGRIYVDAIADANRLTLSDRIRARIGAANPPQLTSTFEVDLVRHADSEDLLAELTDYHFDRGAAVLMGIGEMPEASLPGTVEASGATLTGTGTMFARDAPPGSRLSIEGECAFVESVESNTSLTLTQALAAATSSSPALVRPLYTLGHPRVMAMGSVVDRGFEMTNDDASFKVEISHDGLQGQLVNTYKGFGNGIDMRGAGSADTGTVFDPAGDFTVGLQIAGFLEDVDQASSLMANGDIALLHVATGKIRGQIVTSGGTFTVTSGEQVYDPDIYTFAHLRWDESEDKLDLLIDGVEVDTVATTGTLNTSATAWVIGAHETKIKDHFTGVWREARFYDEYLDDDAINESIEGQLVEIDLESPLVLYYTGEAGVSDDLFEFAAANRSAPKDATLVGWKRAPGMDAPEIAGSIIPRGLGFLEHIPAQNVGLAGATGSSDEVWKLADKPLQDIHHVYEAGESGDADAGGISGAQTIVSRHPTLKGFLDASLTAGQVAAYPRQAVVKLDRIASSEISADASGESFGIRSMHFNGTTSEVDFGTGGNALLTDDFTVAMKIGTQGITSIQQQMIMTNFDTGGIGSGIFVVYSPASGVIEFTVSGMTDGSPSRLEMFSEPIARDGQTVDFWWSVEVDLASNSASGVLIQDGIQVDEATVTGVTAVGLSGNDLLIGQPGVLGPQPFKGYISELSIFDETQLLATTREHQQKDKTGLSGLVHYFPTRLLSFPTATLVDEVGSLDGAMTDIEWRGGLTPTAGSALAEHFVRNESDILSESIDFAGIYEWPTDPLHVFVQRLDDMQISDFMYEVINSFNGWFKWSPPVPEALAGTVSAIGAAVTGSGTAFTSIGLPAAVSFDGETHSIESIESDTALTLVTAHQGATAVPAIVHQPKLSFGWIEDPSGASIDHAFGAPGQPAVLEIETELTGGLPGEFRQAWGWIHNPGEELSDLVSDDRVRLWSKEFRFARRQQLRNQSLPGDRPDYEVISRWIDEKSASKEARRQRVIYRFRRLEGEAIVQDPLGLVRAGEYVTITHSEVEGGSGDFIVTEATRIPTLPEVSLELWGAEADPSA